MLRMADFAADRPASLLKSTSAVELILFSGTVRAIACWAKAARDKDYVF
jgi:hypothetical protein